MAEQEIDLNTTRDFPGGPTTEQAARIREVLGVAEEVALQLADYIRDNLFASAVQFNSIDELNQDDVQAALEQVGRATSSFETEIDELQSQLADLLSIYQTLVFDLDRVEDILNIEDGNTENIIEALRGEVDNLFDNIQTINNLIQNLQDIIAGLEAGDNDIITSITNVEEGDILVYDATYSLWKNQAPNFNGNNGAGNLNLTSPDGTQWKLGINNNGSLIAEPISPTTP